MPALTSAAIAALPLAAKMGGASAIGAGISAIPSLIPTKTQKENKKRLKELERQQEMGMLGLTDREQASIQNALSGQALQAQRRSDAEMRRLAANTMQPQLQMQQAQLSAQNRQDLEARIAQEILQLDLQRKAQQEQELKDVRAAVDEKRQDMVAAGLSPISSGLEGYIQGLTIEQLFGTNLTPEQKTTAVSQKTGLTPEEVQTYLPLVNGDFSIDRGQEEVRFDPLSAQNLVSSTPEATKPSAFDPFALSKNPLYFRPSQETVPNIPVGQALPSRLGMQTGQGFRPDNILTQLGLGFDAQLALAQRGFTQDDMVKLAEYRMRNPNMSTQEALENYLVMSGMGGM